MVSYQIVAKITLETILAFDIVVTFVIPLVTLLTSSPVMWREEYLWNIGVLQRVHFSNLVWIWSKKIVYHFLITFMCQKSSRHQIACFKATEGLNPPLPRGS
jgi:uncharacterized membrane protein YagU involved in acid resistance